MQQLSFLPGELINKAAEKGYSLRVVDDRDSTETPATYASPHQLL